MIRSLRCCYRHFRDIWRHDRWGSLTVTEGVVVSQYWVLVCAAENTASRNPEVFMEFIANRRYSCDHTRGCAEFVLFFWEYTVSGLAVIKKAVHDEAHDVSSIRFRASENSLHCLYIHNISNNWHSKNTQAHVRTVDPVPF